MKLDHNRGILLSTMLSSTCIVPSSSSSLVRFIDLEDFAQLGRIPRYPDDHTLVHGLDSIDISDSLLVFVSHSWLRGDAYPPHPDYETNAKHQLCVNGIRRLKTLKAPNLKKCYLWIDFGCIDQNNKSKPELKEMITIMQCCDLIFTPILQLIPNGNVADHMRDKDAHYVKRGWCRLEMLYASILPLSEQSLAKRLQSVELRPHYAYCSQNDQEGVDPLKVGTFAWFLVKRLDPITGEFTKDEDRQEVRELVDMLEPYIATGRKKLVTLWMIGQRVEEKRQQK